MRFTHDEIREELESRSEEITENDELLDDLAESFCPIYYNEIMSDWAEMPNEFNDRWKELGFDANKNDGGIFQLMSVDLYFYYIDTTREIWQEMKGEQQ